MFILLVVPYLIPIKSLSQPTSSGTGSAKTAKELFKLNNYVEALKEFEILVQKEKNNTDYRYHLALCYLNTNIDKTQALTHLELVVKAKSIPADAFLNLGKAYHHCYRFEDAINSYNIYQEDIKEDTDEFREVQKLIENSNVGKELVKHPIDVTFQNLGKLINTEFPDYNPMIPEDESFLVFTSKRTGNIGGMKDFDGYIAADIYWAKVKSGDWTKAKNMGYLINTELIEEAVGMTPDGDNLYIYIDNINGYGDIYCASKKGRSFQKAIPLDESINQKSFEISASATNDGSMLFFASDREGGYGGSDIYVSKKLPTGMWSEPKNLGPVINTEYDEDFPNILSDNITLYFCSKGHTNMGGHDIFKSIWFDSEENIWTPPKNIGYPINTPADDMSFFPVGSGKHGYLSAARKDSYGDLDIYRVTFNDVDDEYSVVKGMVTEPDSTTVIPDAFITVSDENDNIIGNFRANPRTGKYIMVLAPGNYNLVVFSHGFQNYEGAIKLLDKVDLKPEVNYDIILNKK